jgi:MYXO-CTERM domain-containing protein
MIKFGGVCSLAAAWLLSLANVGQAAAMLVTNEAGITPNGTINWSSAGPNFGVLGNPITVPVSGIPGLQAVVSQASGLMERRDQGTGFPGNFGPGEPLLFTNNGGPVTLNFNNPVQGFGSQIQSGLYGAFTAQIQAFDSSNTLLGSFTENGASNGNGDDSAIFIGVLSTATDISKVIMSLTTAPGNAVNYFLLGPARVEQAQVPEPASMAIWGVSALGLAVAGRRRRSRRSAAARG